MKTAGIDVAAKTLAVVLSDAETNGKARAFANSASGHLALIKVLREARIARICLEATGAYHLDLALALEAAGLAVMVVNPKAAKRFAGALATRQKNDAIDAGVLAEFAWRMPFEPWQRPPTAALQLRTVARRLAALVQQRTQAKNQLHAARQSTTTPAVVLEDLHLSITQCDAQITTLRTWAGAMIAAEPALAEVYALLVSIPGVAAASAIQLMGEVLVLPQGLRAKQWVAQAGLDPRAVSSGTSVNQKPRLSKAGNRYLRLALFMPALSAARCDRHVHGYYRHLIEQRGLKKLQAVCAVMRKLLHAIHGMLTTRTPFTGSRFYVLPRTADGT